MADLLFVYGTLRPGHAPREIAHVVDQLTLVGEGTVRGHRYELGDYPGIVLDNEGPAVTGVLLSLPPDPAILAQLDDYEGFIPAHPEASLFRRMMTTVIETETGAATTCWVYVYNRPL
jgi:gamma-glutamylcyclotransferase (GGCT)/AIG2-like uncharacterized protein YtfP